MSGTSGIAAAVAAAAVPAAVRREGAGAVRGFRVALEFESMLLQQMLTAALPESPTGAGAAAGAEEGEEGAAFGAGPQRASLPETVTAAVVGAGGLGLAAQMYGSFAGTGA